MALRLFCGLALIGFGCSGVETGGVDTGGLDSGTSAPSGRASAGPASEPTGPKSDAVAAGTSHSCARGVDGTVRCWGSHARGELGAPASDICEIQDLLHNMGSIKAPCREAAAPVDGLSDVEQIALAGSTSCARRGDGTVWCWGDNGMGVLGDAAVSERPTAALVPGLTDVAELALSDTHACARVGDGTLRCWGGNFFGQLGVTPVAPPREEVAKNGYSAVRLLTPVTVPGLADVVEVAVGSDITCARKKGGAVLCFGKVAPATVAQVEPKEQPALHGATDLVLGQSTHCALFAGGTMSCWGSSSNGPMMGASASPVIPVPGTAAAAVTALVLSANRACAVAGVGDVRCWGDDGQGATTTGKSIGLPVEANDVALGANHGCALGKDGSVWCWGDSFFGEAGPRRKGPAPTSLFFTAPRRIAMR